MKFVYETCLFLYLYLRTGSGSSIHLNEAIWTDLMLAFTMKSELSGCPLLTYIRGKRSCGCWACKQHLGLLHQAHLEDICNTTKYETHFSMGHSKTQWTLKVEERENMD